MDRSLVDHFFFLTGQAIPEFDNPRSAYGRWVTATVRYSGLREKCPGTSKKSDDDRLPHKLSGPRSLEKKILQHVVILELIKNMSEVSRFWSSSMQGGD
jgi:hypothetical protein